MPKLPKYNVRRFSRNTLVLLANIFTMNLAVQGQALADPVSVSKHMLAGTPWTAGFSVDHHATHVAVIINISLLLSDQSNRTQLEGNKASWLAAIDRTWNNRFLLSAGDRLIPIRFVIKFTHVEPHHRVVIYPGHRKVNQHNWKSDTPGYVIAHEIGHMLGAYDEYRGGTASPNEPIIDRSSIMGSKPEEGLAYRRHLKLAERAIFEPYLGGDPKLSIVPPNPAGTFYN